MIASSVTLFLLLSVVQNMAVSVASDLAGGPTNIGNAGVQRVLINFD